MLSNACKNNQKHIAQLLILGGASMSGEEVNKWKMSGADKDIIADIYDWKLTLSSRKALCDRHLYQSYLAHIMS